MRHALAVFLVTAFCLQAFPSARADRKAGAARPAKTYSILDWSGRSLGQGYSPLWLQKLFDSDAADFKKEHGGGGIIKFSIGISPAIDQAETFAEANLIWQLSLELQQKIVARVSERVDDEDAVRDLAADLYGKPVTVHGARRVAVFWQKIAETDSKNGAVQEKYIFYCIYSINEDAWNKTVDEYAAQAANSLYRHKPLRYPMLDVVAEIQAEADGTAAERSAADRDAYGRLAAMMASQIGRTAEQEQAEAEYAVARTFWEQNTR